MLVGTWIFELPLILHNCALKIRNMLMSMLDLLTVDMFIRLLWCLVLLRSSCPVAKLHCATCLLEALAPRSYYLNTGNS